MANFLNEIIESSIQPVKTNVLWIKNGVPYYYNKRWKPLLGGASGGTVDSPITFGEGEYSAILQYSNNKTLGDRSIALGYGLTSNNNYEASFGKYNKSIKSDDTSKATLFSIGNGTSSFLKNVFEVKQNGDIYIEGLDKSVQNYLRSIEEYDELLEDLSNRITITDSKLETKFEEFEEGINGELEEYYSKLTQTAKEIRAEVGSITTELDGRITENTALISITAKEIRSEVSEITTDLDGRIETNKSSISQTAEEIRAEVSRVQTDLSGRIDTANSTISQTADAIRLEVEAVEGELNGKIERNTSLINQTAESIGLEVTNLSDHLNDVNSELAGLIAENKAAIEINANEIKNKVSSDTFNAFSGEVQNQFTEVSTTIEGVRTSVQNLDGKLTEVNATVNGVTTRLGTAEADIESLKKQSDGSIDTHFGTEAPTLNNEPAVNWVTDDLKNEHTGDIYYNNNTGEAYRFSYNPETNEYFWIELTDSALTDALDKISKLESAVDGKVTIFYTTPTNYKYGDMWFVHEDNASFKKGTLVSATNLDKGTIRATLVLADWKEEIEYVNFDELTEELTSLNDYIDNAFKDGVLSEAEIKHIQELKKNFQLSYKEINDLNSFLIITAFATEENKTALNNAKKALDTAFNELIDAIDNLNTELDDEGNNPSLALYNEKYQAYLKALDDYTEIAVLIQSEAEQELLKPSDYIKQISSDGYLTSIEKKQLIAVWKQIAEEFTANRGIAFNYKILKKEGNNYIDRTDIYDVDTRYHTIYNNYKNSYEAIASIFTDETDPFGFKDLQNTTILSETTIESLASIEQLFDTYYANLALFSEMISKISNDITDAHQKVIDVTNALVDQLDPREAITQIGTGVVLSSVLGVKDIDGNLEAVLNGSDSIEEAQSTKHGNHGKIVFAGGINGSSKWDDATTIIYEDGHVVINSGEISDFVSIGNATFKNVVEAVTQFDVISSPHVNPDTGEIEYIPLFQVNRNDAGEIIYVSSVYDFVGNREISALGFNAGGGSSGGGLISKVYNVNNFGNITDTTNTATFNAYAIDSLYKRIVSLENKEVDLTGYATEAWVAGQGFITSAALSPYMKAADANDTFATKTALNNLSSSHDSLAAIVSTAEGNISTNAKGIADNKTAIATNKNNISANATAITNLGKRVTANEGNIAEILKWFAVDSDGNLYTTYNLYSTKEISANGLSIGSGGSGGGLISQVYGVTAFGTIAAESNSATFNAYAIDSLYKRIVSLEGKATAVSFVPALTSGKQIGTLSIDGVSTALYAPAGYAWSEVSGKPTLIESEGVATDGSPKVNRFGLWQGKGAYWSIGHDSNYVIQAYATANGVYLRSLTGNTDSGWKKILREGDVYSKADADGTFLKLSGGEINGYLSVRHSTSSIALGIKSNATDYAAIRFTGKNGNSAYLIYSGTGDTWEVTNVNWNRTSALLHANNYSQYALPLTGGTITGGAGALEIKRNGSYLSNIKFSNTDGELGKLGFVWANNPAFFHTDGNYYPLYHTGNFNPANYLPLTGGSIVSSTIGCPLYLANTKETWNAIGFKGNSHSDYAYFGLGGDGNFFVTTTGWTAAYGLIHSGNIGSQFVEGIGTAYANQSIDLGREGKVRMIYGTASNATSLGYPRQYTSGLSVLTGYTGWQMVTYGGTSIPNPYFRSLIENGTFSDWKQLAFLTDNVASATKLATARTIWGQSFDGTGNVTGALKTPSGYNAVTILDSHLVLGQGMAENSLPTYLDGYNVYMRYGKSSTIGFTLNSSGNTTIGSTGDLAGTDYKLVVNGLSRFKNNVESEGNIIGAGAVQAKNNAHGFISLQVGSTGNKGLLDSRTSWILYTDGTNTLLPQGNVGIGTTTPAYKLDVNGTLRATGAVTMGSTLSVTGATTMNSTLIVNGDVTAASTIKANSVICATTRLRVNATNNVNVFGFIDAALYGTTNNVATVHIGSCYGGSSTITNTGEYPNGASMTAISIYRGVVGIGKRFSDSELRAAYGEGVSLTTSGGLTSTGLITASSGVKVASGQAITFLDASGKEHKLTYDSTAGAFKFDGNILVLGDGQFNAIN